MQYAMWVKLKGNHAISIKKNHRKYGRCWIYRNHNFYLYLKKWLDDTKYSGN